MLLTKWKIGEKKNKTKQNINVNWFCTHHKMNCWSQQNNVPHCIHRSSVLSLKQRVRKCNRSVITKTKKEKKEHQQQQQQKCVQNSLLLFFLLIVIHFVARSECVHCAYFGIRSCAIAPHVRTDEMCNQLMCRGGSYKICDVVKIDRCHPISAYTKYTSKCILLWWAMLPLLFTVYAHHEKQYRFDNWKYRDILKDI